MIEGLSEEDKELLRLRYGNDLDNPISTISYKDKIMFNTYLVPKMRKLLSGKEITNNKSNKLPTIYKLLGNYTREEIDEMIEELSDEDKELLRLRYGDDLDNPVSTIGYDDKHRYYNYLVPKMRKLLAKMIRSGSTLRRKK